MNDLVIRASSPEQARLVRQFLEAVAGRTDFASDLVAQLYERVAMVLLSLIQEDFVTKARGGTGVDGITWPPLKPETIAQRRTTAEERKALGIGGRRFRGLLTASEDKLWRRIFATRKAWLVAKFGMGEGAACSRAAQIAWTILKAQGAKTKLAVLGQRVVEMLRDTGRLFNSLSPGSGDEEQILRYGPGAVTVGSNVRYANRQHRMRPFWPTGGTLPPAYRAPLIAALRSGIAEAVVILGARAA